MDDSAEYSAGLYLSLIAYFGILLGSAIWAYKRMKRMTRGKDGMDHLSSHYLGGRRLGPLLMTGMLLRLFKVQQHYNVQKSHTHTLEESTSHVFCVSLFALSFLSIRHHYRNVVCNRLFRLYCDRCSVSDACRYLSLCCYSGRPTHNSQLISISMIAMKPINRVTFPFAGWRHHLI
jgi:hypothetical protein